MGWGEPGVGINGVVHYVYAGQGQQPNDHGDIYYVRSTDNGSTWSAPIMLNDDPGGQYKTQWMPSLSVNYNPASPQQSQGHRLLVRSPAGHLGLQQRYRSRLQLLSLRDSVG